MQNAVIVTGRLVGPTSVQLDEPVASGRTEVEVLIRPLPDARLDQAETLSAYLRRLPAGMRSKEEIDLQIHTERDSWGDQ